MANFCCEKLARNQVGQSGQSLKVVSARRARAMNDAVALLRATPRMLADAVVASAEEIARECKRAVARDAQAKLATSNDKRNAAQQRSPATRRERERRLGMVRQ